MAFDTTTRNKLAALVTRCRGRLVEEFSDQFQQFYGIVPKEGTVADLGSLTHLNESQRETARQLHEVIDYYAESNSGSEAQRRKDAIDRLLREQAFTVLNRLAALRMAEERGIVLECVRQGTKSEGFTLFEMNAGTDLGDAHQRYVTYLECLYDELSIDLGVLFDRFSPHGLLFPGEAGLKEVLAFLGDADIKHLWAEDETIGWIYQYWNSKEERKAMRDASAAPRNSRELAVRNQFFTPRYVVEFLTDNTLGRIWYEMTQGQTRLVDQCRYLVRRPNEIFLAPIEEIYRSLYGEDTDLPDDIFETDAIADLFRGNLERIAEGDDGSFPLLKGIVAYKSFESYFGERWDLNDNSFLDDVTNAVFRGEDHPNKWNLVWGLAVITHYLTNSQLGSPYAKESLALAREYFQELIRRHLDSQSLSQEELLKRPVLIPHRAIKDPREIRLLDPACGSMHFGLYAFDLFEAIYEEAWDLASTGNCQLITENSHAPLTDLYASKEAFMLDVPKLIIENNVHGVDIDPRAVQIAGLSLWLRAQKTWKDTPAAERPRVRRSNIVCAEPMPGSDAMLEDFVGTLDPPLLGELVKTVFDKMQLAGEAGTLLKIEEEIRTAIDDAKTKWKKLGAAERDLFSTEELNQTLRPGTQQELTGVEKALTTDHRPLATDFFDTAEERIYAALRDYAESAEAGDYQRRLFAEDAAHGFAFIDLCRKRYDAVVMNPPFGAFSKTTKKWAENTFPRSSSDIYSSFIDRGIQLFTSGALLGAITSRTGFFLRSFTRWREKLLLPLSPPNLIADLGHGVLDDAMVEVAAYCLGGTNRNSSTFFRIVDAEDRASALLNSIKSSQDAVAGQRFECAPSSFKMVPGSPFAYWVSDSLRAAFEKHSPLKTSDRFAARGPYTLDDFRFVRIRWEIATSSIKNTRAQTTDTSWVRFVKGGDFARFYADPHLALNWSKDGLQLKALVSAYRESKGWGPNWTAAINGHDFYFLPGLTWTHRTSSDLSLRALPAGCIFSAKGPALIVEDREQRLALLSLCNSSVFRSLFSLNLGAADAAARSYDVGIMQRMPIPELDPASKDRLARLAYEAWKLWRRIGDGDETSHSFLIPCTVERRNSTLGESSNGRFSEHLELQSRCGEIDQEIDSTCFDIYGAAPIKTEQDIEQSIHEGDTLKEVADSMEPDDDICGPLVLWMIGAVFGRWDIRYATGERQPPELPDPFDPLPVCPPGMLQNADGLPAAPADVPDDYPLPITWPGILVSDPGHPEDIVARVRDALAVIWGDRSAAIEQEACEILGVRTLRDYFAEKKSGGKFFKDHLKRYSKSRRQAPIYWPLSTESGSYTLWIYYHRLTPDTLYTCVSDFIEPKITAVGRELERLTAKGDQRSARENRDWERLADLSGELQVFRDELLRIANLPWKPNLNDGVQITAAPLWNLFRLKPWQTKLKATWKSLEKGDYDWAHLAHTLWPERVIPKCTTDRSLAIAHGHEDALWEEVKNDKGKLVWQPKKNADQIAQELVQQHQA
ncbi:MAG: BREX-1 system adenine-specific DNA-methyltransferase PglX [Akkermansiaceae bacterium]|nr:BREX-1 system adenine-specific DNA-methyltransferase PglX [Akkermansiaceae bacterium]